MQVVDAFEVVEVDHDAGDGARGTVGRIPDAIEFAEESAAVQTACQGVAGGEPFQFEILPFDLVAGMAELLQHSA